ncbi:sentrin-specific protease-like [Ptychodera flava]|uniref:sentrin-specific protease-like n=1 Tax=Ptychodera flava TaxID=63121 RepID=UPI00396A3535
MHSPPTGRLQEEGSKLTLIVKLNSTEIAEVKFHPTTTQHPTTTLILNLNMFPNQSSKDRHFKVDRKVPGQLMLREKCEKGPVTDLATMMGYPVDVSGPDIYTFSTFLYAHLLRNGYVAVQRWTSEADLFLKDIVLFPINVNDSHWIICAADMRTRTLRCYDSLFDKGVSRMVYLNKLREYLSLERKKVYGKDAAAWNWTLECVRQVPQQRNGFDCGVFVCLFARLIASDVAVNFTQEEVGRFRNQIVYEILHKRILDWH